MRTVPFLCTLGCYYNVILLRYFNNNICFIASYLLYMLDMYILQWFVFTI